MGLSFSRFDHVMIFISSPQLLALLLAPLLQAAFCAYTVYMLFRGGGAAYFYIFPHPPGAASRLLSARQRTRRRASTDQSTRLLLSSDLRVPRFEHELPLCM